MEPEKKKNSLPAGVFTKEDIKAMREYIDSMDKIIQEAEASKEILTPEEWDEAMKEIRRTGKIPARYAGRIGEEEITIYSDIVDGKHKLFPEGITKKVYYDTTESTYSQKISNIQLKYSAIYGKALYYATQEAIDENGHFNGYFNVGELIREFLKDRVLDITNLPNLLPTDKHLQYALTPYRNDYAYIMPFDYEQLHFDYDENGEIVIKTEAQYNAFVKAKDKKEIEAAGIDQPLLRQLFAATMKAYLCNYGNSITVYLPSFAREMGIDIYYSNLKAEERNAGKKGNIPRHNSNDFFKKLEALEKLNGVWQGGSFYRVFVLEGYEAEQNTLTFSSPWLFKVTREILQTPANKKTRADGSIMWEITGISSLMKPSIASARSKPTVEILATLLVGLQQYGTKPEAKRHPGKKYRDNELVEYKISFKTLIERIPLIMENLNKCNPSTKTTLLQRYFCGINFKKRQKEGKGFILEEYIRKHTFIMDYYKDFEIIIQPPTVKTLSDKITIRHRGINGGFKANNALNEFLFQDKPQEESIANPEE